MDKKEGKKERKKRRPAVDKGCFFKRVGGELFFWKGKSNQGGCRLKFYQAAVKFARLSRCEMYCNVKIRKGGEKLKACKRSVD